MKYGEPEKYRLRLLLIQFMVYMPKHPAINDIKEALRK